MSYSAIGCTEGAWLGPVSGKCVAPIELGMGLLIHFEYNYGVCVCCM